MHLFGAQILLLQHRQNALPNKVQFTLQILAKSFIILWLVICKHSRVLIPAAEGEDDDLASGTKAEGDETTEAGSDE